jgi:hypothetical protein
LPIRAGHFRAVSNGPRTVLLYDCREFVMHISMLARR